MEMNHDFRYPLAEAGVLGFPEALDLMLESRAFFRNKGFENYRYSSAMGLDARVGSEDYLDQGMFELRKTYSNSLEWDMRNKLVFPDGAAMGYIDFTCFDDIDQLLKNIIKRGAKIEAKMPLRPQLIKTRMHKSFEYTTNFYVQTKELQKGFFPKKCHDLESWVYSCSVRLNESYIDEVKAQEFNELKAKFQDFMQDYSSRKNNLGNEFRNKDYDDNAIRS